MKSIIHLIQLPSDVVSRGYRQIGYVVEQVFYSPSNNFEGTEREFVEAGLGYAYVQIDKFARRIVSLG